MGGVFESAKQMAWESVVRWSASQGMVIDDVIIEGRNRTDSSALKNAVHVKPDDPILSVDVDAIQSKVEDMNWVKDVTVSRNYNGIIKINITEKIPFVLWDRPGRAPSVVDTDGKIIEGANPNEFQGLLSVRGVDAPRYTVDLMTMILAEPDIAKLIKGAEWIGDRRWDLITINGTRILLPEDDIGYALSRLAKAQAEKNILDRSLLSIDLRGTDRIIIETDRGMSQDMMHLSSNPKTSAI